MEAKIRNKSGESTLTIKGDFYQILDENFKEICKAITNKVKSLKELKALLDADDQILNTIVLIIKKSLTPEAAALKLQEELGMSKMAVKYLLNMPLFTLVSLTAEGIEQTECRRKHRMGTQRTLEIPGECGGRQRGFD